MDQLHNILHAAVGPDRVDRCNLLGYRIITAALLTHSTSFFSHPIYCDARTTLALPVVTQIRGHKAGSPPRPHYGTCPNFYREKNSAFSSLVDSR